MSEGEDSDWESAVDAVSAGLRALRPPSGQVRDRAATPPSRSPTRSPSPGLMTNGGAARRASPSPLGEASSSSAGGSFCDPRADAAAKSWIDPFLREALESGGDARMAVLRIDAEIGGFAADGERASHEFAGNGYQRMIAHKVAAHHGLASCAVVGADGQDRALIEKEGGATAMDPPAVSLSDVRGDNGDAGKADAKKKKVTVMKRGGGGGGGRGGGRGGAGGFGAGHGNSGGGKKPGSMSVEEREAEYERARERIFGGAGGGEDSGRTSPAADEGSAPRSASPGTNASGASSLSRQTGAKASRSETRPGSRHTREGETIKREGGGRGRQAIVRNRAADSMDPDFVRMPPPAAFHPPPMQPARGGGYYEGGGYYDPRAPPSADPYAYRDAYPPPGYGRESERADVGRGGYGGGGFGGFGGGGFGGGGDDFPALGGGGWTAPPTAPAPTWAPPPPGAPPPVNQPMRGHDAPFHGTDARVNDGPHPPARQQQQQQQQQQQAPPLRFGNFQQLGRPR